MTSELELQLGNLFAYDKTSLLSDPDTEKLDEYIITLSLIYNDLKTISMLNNHLSIRFPKQEKPVGIDKYIGQSNGIQIQCFRLFTGILEELFTLIEQKSKEGLFDEAVWKRTENKLMKKKPDLITFWKTIVSISTKQHVNTVFEQSLRKFLIRVRAHTFHYYNTKLFKKGFIEHFKQDIPEAEHLYTCYGNNMQETRFFFADAAIDKAIQVWMQDLPENFMEDFNNFIFRTHKTIRYIIEYYFNIKQITLYQKD